MRSIVRHSTIPYTETMFEGIHRLAPGHHLRVDANRQPTIRRYWRPEKIKIDESLSEKEAQLKFQELLDLAVSSRLDRSGITGCELSGGLDSSSILSWLKYSRPSSAVTAFSMTFASLEECDESVYIDSVVDKYDVDHVRLPTDTLDYENKFDLEYNYRLNPYWPIFITYTMGFPLVEAARKRGIKVVLTGQGGDHLMSGSYHCLHDYFKSFRWISLYQELKASETPSLLCKRFIVLPLIGPRGKKLISAARRLLRRNGSASPPIEPPPFSEFSDLYEGSSLAFRHDLYEVVNSRLSALNDNSYYQVAEMRYGIEFRHPFFDRRLVEFMLSLPPHFKMRRGVFKYLLRQALDDVLPEPVLQRGDKARFNEVIRQQIEAADFENCLTNAHIGRLGIVDQEDIDKLVHSYLDGKLKNIIGFWQLLNLEYWYRFNFVGTTER